jgi:hypothetical protein
MIGAYVIATAVAAVLQHTTAPAKHQTPGAGIAAYGTQPVDATGAAKRENTSIASGSTAPSAVSKTPGPAEKTLGELRSEYLGKRIVLRKSNTTSCVAGLHLTECLVGWHHAERQRERYAENFGEPIEASYAAQTPTVIAIQLARTLDHTAFGDTLSEDETKNPYVDVVVQFNNGQIALGTNYFSCFEDPDCPHSFELASLKEQRAVYLAKALPGVVGRNLYAVAESKIFELNADTEELTRADSVFTLDAIPYLEPLRIVDARYNRTIDRVLLKLELPDHNFGIAASRYHGDSGVDILDAIAGKFLTAVPKGLTAEELKAIQKHELFRGMTRDALLLSWGSPSKENNWGRGGNQLVYNDTEYVYLDSANMVTEWQKLGN